MALEVVNTLLSRFISSFLADTITMLFIQVHFYGSHKFPYRSLLLSTTILNDTQGMYIVELICITVLL